MTTDILKYFKAWIYLSAGIWGAFLNFISMIVLIYLVQCSVLSSFIVGFAINAIFNIWFSFLYLSLTNPSSKANRPYINAYFLTHLLLLAIGIGFLEISTKILGLEPWLYSALSVCILSLVSLLIGRIWVFISPNLAKIAYENLSGAFYEDSTNADQVGWFRSWYHVGRYVELLKLVKSVSKKTDTIYDFGCGGSEWNKEGLTVIGIDINSEMLEYGKSRGQLTNYHVAPLENTGLPDAAADIAVISEVIEHIEYPRTVLKEIHRCLKPQGTLVLTVPWDTIFSPFFWLFNVQCFYRGYILNEEYYRQRCGHINHFSKKNLQSLLKSQGFDPVKIYRFRGLLLYSVSKRV